MTNNMNNFQADPDVLTNDSIINEECNNENKLGNFFVCKKEDDQIQLKT